MPTIQIFIDDKENELVETLSKKWNLSKYETVKKIIREYREREKKEE